METVRIEIEREEGEDGYGVVRVNGKETSAIIIYQSGEAEMVQYALGNKKTLFNMALGALNVSDSVFKLAQREMALQMLKEAITGKKSGEPCDCPSCKGESKPGLIDARTSVLEKAEQEAKG